MVQRTAAGKYGVQSEGVKGERRVASFKPTSSSSQNTDGKNRAADLKKKMKKSRAIQLSDFESFTSSQTRKNVTLPGKPPPSSNVSEIKQKQSQQNQASVVRTSDGSPNYMKSTSCFDARKEVSQVSARNSRISNDNKKPRRRNLENSAHGSVSGLKPTKCLTKCSSKKLVRTLTKTPSFKKSSRVALCADMNSNRATCSSTLKDSKFPAYLMLSPGATESEGTSAMKVCPYSYCSLNGHRHAPLPPLKCFLSSRRRLLKTQKNLKVEPSGCGVKEVDAGGKVVDEEMATEVLITDGGLDFFIEIYAENMADGAGSIDQERVADGDCTCVTSFTVNNEVESSNEEDDKLVSEKISDGSMVSELCLSEEVTGGMFGHGNEYEDDAGSTDTEMEEWEERQFLSMEGDDLDGLEDQLNAETVCLSDETRLQDGELVGYGQVVKDCKGVFSKTEKEFYEGSGDFEEQFYTEDSELNRHPDWEVEEASQVSESLSYDQLSYSEDAFDEMGATQTMVERAEIEYLELILNSELESEVIETDCVTRATEEASNKVQENQDLQVDGTSPNESTGSGDCVETNERYCRMEEEVFLFDCQLPDHDLVLQEEILDADIDNQMEKEEQLDDANHGAEVSEDEISGQENANICLEDYLSHGQCQDISANGNRNSVAEQDEIESSTVMEMTGIEGPSDLKTDKTCLNDNSIAQVDIMDGKDRADSSLKAPKRSSRIAIDSGLELDLSIKKWEGNTKCRRLGDESEDPRNFNPREPNYLPLVPDPEAEKVDLKHQLMDDRKNTEEWMLDYALQRTVTKLAPAKKKKVALLVEAFESVMPTSKCEIHLRNNTSGAFTPAKHIQACF